MPKCFMRDIMYAHGYGNNIYNVKLRVYQDMKV